MTQDRTYFRMLSDAALTEAARYCDNDLALVLGERLEAAIAAEDQLEAAQAKIEELHAEIASLDDDVAELVAQIDAMEAETANDTHTD